VPTNRLDIAAALSYLAGPGLMTAAVGFGDAWPAHAKAIVAITGGVVWVAGLLSRLFKNPSPPAGTQPVLQQKAP
jgi:hypothetical protein